MPTWVIILVVLVGSFDALFLLTIAIAVGRNAWVRRCLSKAGSLERLYRAG